MNASAPHQRHPRPAVLLAVARLGVGLVLGGFLAAAPASADDRAPKPMLSISLDDGRTSAEAGDTLDYTITVVNLGTDAVEGLRVTQTMPGGLTFESADRGGTARAGLVVWSVDLAPERTRVLHTSMTVGETPDEVLRMASVACASPGARSAPLVCATHSDELPAGREARSQDEAAAADAADRTASGADHGTAAWVGLLGGGAVVVAVVLTLLRRRRMRSAAPAL